LISFYVFCHHPPLPSFPTRRSSDLTPFAGGQCGLSLLLMDQGIDGVMKASAADAGNQATSWRQYVHGDLVTENPLPAGRGIREEITRRPGSGSSASDHG